MADKLKTVVTKGKAKLLFLCDWDERYADSYNCQCQFKVVSARKLSTLEVVQLLKLANAKVDEETSFRSYGFLPEKVNEVAVPKKLNTTSCAAIEACLQYLQKHPETTEFVVDGGME